MQNVALIMDKVPALKRGGDTWYSSQDVAMALGVRPEKITQPLPPAFKLRIKVGNWPMERHVMGINADGLTRVWRRYGMVPMDEFREWLHGAK